MVVGCVRPDTLAGAGPDVEVLGGRAVEDRALTRVRCSPTVDVNHVDTHGAVRREGADDGAQRFRGTAGAADDASQVVGVHAHLENITSRGGLGRDDDLVRVVYDPLDQVLESWCEQDL